MRAAGEQTGEPSSDGRAERSAESAASDDSQRTFGHISSLNCSKFTFQARQLRCTVTGPSVFTDRTEAAAETVLQETGHTDSAVSEDAAAQGGACLYIHTLCHWGQYGLHRLVQTPQCNTYPPALTD